MSKLTGRVTALIDRCSLEEKRTIFDYTRRQMPVHALESEWNTSADAILTAIARATDLTRRGIRGILAEATFEEVVIPPLNSLGWRPQLIVGEQAYDFLLRRDLREVRIQVKLQRREAGKPKQYGTKAKAAINYASDKSLYVVEVQKTRSGERAGQKTRPYRFGDFDILAVNLHPSTGDWKKFLYTVGTWLIPRTTDERLIDIFQPVPLDPDHYWTDDLIECIKWLSEGRNRTLYD